MTKRPTLTVKRKPQVATGDSNEPVSSEDSSSCLSSTFEDPFAPEILAMASIHVVPVVDSRDEQPDIQPDEEGFFGTVWNDNLK